MRSRLHKGGVHKKLHCNTWPLDELSKIRGREVSISTLPARHRARIPGIWPELWWISVSSGIPATGPIQRGAVKEHAAAPCQHIRPPSPTSWAVQRPMPSGDPGPPVRQPSLLPWPWARAAAAEQCPSLAGSPYEETFCPCSGAWLAEDGPNPPNACVVS